jgi:serine/threonine-protein kinase
VRAGVVPPPSSVNPAVPPELDRICLRALARRIEDRYQRAEELAHDLDRVVRELDWGPARAADLACELFPTVIAVEDALATTAVPNPAAPPAREAKGDATPKAQAPRGPRRSWARRLWPLAPLALVVGAVLVARRAQLASRTVPPPAPVLPATVGGPPPTTPLLLTLPRGREKHRVRIRKRSYQEYATEVVADRDARLDLSLTPSWAVPFSPKPTRPARSPRD